MTQKRKRVSRFVYTGLGFPVELRGVELVQFRDKWAPDVKLNQLSRDAFLALATKPTPLSGNEVRFVRHHMRLTLHAFAEHLRVTHQAVMKWERAGAETTGMAWGTELSIRLWILREGGLGPSRFFDAYVSLEALPVEEDEEWVMVYDLREVETRAGFEAATPARRRSPHLKNR